MCPRAQDRSPRDLPGARLHAGQVAPGPNSVFTAGMSHGCWCMGLARVKDTGQDTREPMPPPVTWPLVPGISQTDTALRVSLARRPGPSLRALPDPWPGGGVGDSGTNGAGGGSVLDFFHKTEAAGVAPSAKLKLMLAPRPGWLPALSSGGVCSTESKEVTGCHKGR